MNTRRKQGGITLIGFIIVAAVVGFFIYIGMKLFSMYSEYYSVRTALKSLASEPGIARYEPAKIQDLFFRRMNISYAQNLKKEHVKIQRGADGGWQMTVQYEVRKPLIANLDVVGKFHASQALTNTGVE